MSYDKPSFIDPSLQNLVGALLYELERDRDLIVSAVVHRTGTVQFTIKPEHPVRLGELKDALGVWYDGLVAIKNHADS